MLNVLHSGTPWAITPDYMQVLLAAAERMPEIENVAAKPGRYLPGSEAVTVRDSVAIVSVVGPIMRYDSWWFRVASIATLAQDFRTALDDPAVRAILLNIDSPGGDVNGVNEFADMVFQARDQKLIVAYSGGMIASGAYWIGSAASEIVINGTTQAGSIGTVITVDQVEDTRGGRRRYQIVSSQSPDKVIDVSQDAGRAKYQKLADDMAGIFVDAVARNRDISQATVLSDFGQGGLFIGQEAIASGMADRIGSMESVLSELSAEVNQPRRSFSMSIKTGPKGPIAVSTTVELRAALAAGHTGDEITIQTLDVELIRASAKADGIAEEQTRSTAAMDAVRKQALDTERARIASIHAITLTGFEARAQEAIKSGATAEAFAIEQAKLAKDRGTTVEALRSTASVAVTHGGDPSDKATADGKRPWSEAVKRYSKK